MKGLKCSRKVCVQSSNTVTSGDTPGNSPPHSVARFDRFGPVLRRTLQLTEKDPALQVCKP